MNCNLILRMPHMWSRVTKQEVSMWYPFSAVAALPYYLLDTFDRWTSEKREGKTITRFCFLIFCIWHLILFLWWVFLFQFMCQWEIIQLTYVTDVPNWRSGLILPGTVIVLLYGKVFLKQHCRLFCAIWYNNTVT